MISEKDIQFMTLALQEAERAKERQEVPVGAVVVFEGAVVSQAHNLRESLCNPVAHAELLALQYASKTLKRWRLSGSILYVTLEPCSMCAGAALLARVGRIAYGCPDEKAGACGSVLDIPRDFRLNHQAEVVGGVLETECRKVIQDFFRDRRAQGTG